MKKSALLGAALLAVFGSSAFASGMGPNAWPPEALPQAASQQVTRAQVKAELVKAEQDGTLARDNRTDYPAAHGATTDSGKTRAQVVADLSTPTSPDVGSLYRGGH